ncbi:MAG: hypothetical protein ACNS62_01585 [Candidatus Cyclobacteriaceae bacterium M3_2C_046]
MKSRVKNLFMVLFFVPVVLFAGTEFDENDETANQSNYNIYYDSQAGSFNLVYLPSSNQTVKVNIYDVNGKLIFVDKMRSDQVFFRPYNFKNLKSGDYTFEIIDQGKKLTEIVEYRKNTPVVNQLVNPKVFVENINTGDRINLKVFGAQGETVQVQFYDNNDNLVFTDEIENAYNFSKVYNLEKIKNEKLAVRVSIRNKSVMRKNI